eukprot:4308876-Alexandrium_andersonii.AAC.1
MDADQAVETGQRGDALSLHTAPKPGRREAGRPAERGQLRLKVDRNCPDTVPPGGAMCAG